eukprot:754469-Alexandrium_andersonii.AAC.1
MASARGQSSTRPMPHNGVHEKSAVSSAHRRNLCVARIAHANMQPQPQCAHPHTHMHKLTYA